jgi:hypothetical protein
MAQHPHQHAQDYGLSRDVNADIEDAEGPPTKAQHGETRTRVPEHIDRQGHGAKTKRQIKDTINRGNGTH